MNLALVATVVIALAASSPGARAAAPDPEVTPRGDGQTVRLQDAQGDTWSYTDASGYQAEANPAADVLRARITHGPYAVGVRMVFDDLRRTGTLWYRVEIATPTGTSWFVVEATRHRYAGTAYQDVDGEWVQVRGLRHHIDYAADTMRLRVARELLGEPPWVRARLRDDLGLPDGTFFTDNPTGAGPRSAFTARIPELAAGPGSPS